MTTTLCTLVAGALALAGCAFEVGEDDQAELTEIEGPGSQLCVYADADFQGKAACWGGIGPGERVTVSDLDGLPVGNDQISSFKVKRGVKVRFFSDVDRGGAEYRANGFFGQVVDSNLGVGGKPVGNDAVSSIVIERNSATAGDWDPDRDWQICVYQHADYQGEAECYGGVSGRAYVPALFHTAVGNDSASSIEINDGVRVTLYSAVNYSGTAVTLDRDTPSINATALGNDALSSLVIDAR
jgi:hypothetical protein